MKKAFLGTLVGAAAVACVAASMNSGLGLGENVTPFHPNHVSGPLAGSTNCFPCTFQNRPQVQVWVNGDDLKNIAPIAKTLNEAMGKNKDFKGLVVFITDEKNSAAVAATLKDVSKKPGLGQVGMAYINKDNEAIGNYKINTGAEVKNTVFVYKNWKVEQKFVNLKSDEKGLAQLNAAISAVTK